MAVFPTVPGMSRVPSASNSHSADFLLFSLLLPALLVCILVPAVLILRKPRLRLPPGPPGLPVIGHFHLLGINPHRSLADLSKRYGPLMFLRFGSVPVLVVSSPAMARLVLQAHDKVFAWRAQPTVPMTLFECKNVLFSQPGPYWKLVRQICATDLFGNKRLESFREMIAEEVGSMLSAIANAPEKVHVRAKLYEVTSRIISTMAVGKPVQELGSKSKADPSLNLVTVLLEVIALLGVMNLGDYIPWLEWMDLQGCRKKSKAILPKLERAWQEVIDERRSLQIQGADNGNKQVDFLDVLLSAAASEGMSDANIMAILSDMYGAGIDTSTVSIEWAFAELLTQPSIMKKAQAELETVVGPSRLVQETDARNLPYLRAVVKETMRLHPVLPLLVPHVASEQCKLSEFDVPVHTQAYINVWAIGRDPALWDRPSEFWPERFLDSNIDVRGQHFELLPFGSGRRACPGLALGLSNVHLMLANLIHAFDWTTVADAPVSLSEKFGIVTTVSQPVLANASLKIPRHLLQTQRSS